MKLEIHTVNFADDTEINFPAKLPVMVEPEHRHLMGVTLQHAIEAIAKGKKWTSAVVTVLPS